MNEKIKGALIPLGTKWHSAQRNNTVLNFDENVWRDMTDVMVEEGFNTLFVDIHEGLHYGSHPELAVDGAWTRQKMRKEIARLKEMGITLVPKLNFSACHDYWLCEYRMMRSTKEYYRVCRELIMEVSALFPDSPYFNIGMDEEDALHVAGEEHCAFRQGKLLWHDMQFLADCVRDCGKTPIIWGSKILPLYEEFKANISTDDLLIGMSYYHGVKEEHWTKTDSREDYYNYYFVNGHYVGQNMEYIERDDPFYIRFRNLAKQVALDGYDVFLNVSNFYRHPHNADDVVDMMVNEWPGERVKGIITSMWYPTIEKHRDNNITGIKLLGEALRKYNY